MTGTKDRVTTSAYNVHIYERQGYHFCVQCSHFRTTGLPLLRTMFTFSNDRVTTSAYNIHIHMNNIVSIMKQYGVKTFHNFTGSMHNSHVLSETSISTTLSAHFCRCHTPGMTSLRYIRTCRQMLGISKASKVRQKIVMSAESNTV
jgi:hypothetical protein